MSNVSYEERLVDKIKAIQDDYYNKNKKNTIFKNKQKFDCANTVSNILDLQQLIDQTIYIIPNTNKIFFDYTFFKLFANKDNFNIIVDHTFELLQKTFIMFEKFDLYVNMESFTVSAFERYKDILIDFINKCLLNNTKFSDNMTFLYICNVPKTFDAIIKSLKPFIEKQVYEKIKLLDEETSKQNIIEFHSFRDSI
jgi:hypothetical protein